MSTAPLDFEQTARRIMEAPSGIRSESRTRIYKAFVAELRMAFAAGAAVEREACADLADPSRWPLQSELALLTIQNAIRCRGTITKPEVEP